MKNVGGPPWYQSKAQSILCGKQWNELLEEKVNILVDNGCEDCGPHGHTYSSSLVSDNISTCMLSSCQFSLKFFYKNAYKVYST